MKFTALLLYLIGSIVRPQDWVEFMRNFPYDWITLPIIIVMIVVAATPGQATKVLHDENTKRISYYFLFLLASLIVVAPMQVPERFLQYARFFGAYLAFGILADTANRMARVMTTIVIIAAIIGYQGITLAHTGIGLAGQGLYWGGRIRWVGMYDGANVLCMLFVIASAFVVHVFFGPFGSLSRICTLIAAPFLVYGIYLTQSRGGFLALVVVMGLSVLLLRAQGIQGIRLRHLAIAGIVGGLLLTLAPERMGEINDQQHSASGRIDAWQEGIEMLKDSRLLGVGEGQWLQHHRRLAHNSFVQSMGEVGAVGLYLWLAIVYGIGKGLLLCYSQATSPANRAVARALLAALAGFLACSWFITTTQFDLLYIFAGLTSALLAANELRVTFDRADFMRIGAIEVAGITLVWVTVRAFYAMA